MTALAARIRGLAALAWLHARPVLLDMRKDRPFLAAAAVLFLAAVGWQAAVKGLGLALTKQPVPWPASTMVMAEDDPRNITLPLSFGPYERFGEFGVIDKDKKGKTEGPPDGETVLLEDVVETLLGPSIDRFKGRCSNWYVARVYANRNEPKNTGLWNLTLTYYTGGVDTVPHTFDICGGAGGLALESSGNFDVDIPDAPEGWKHVTFNRGVMVNPDGARQVFYEVFSSNGKPEASRYWVRLRQWDFTKHYGYFGKIQIFPRTALTSDTDAKAIEFIRQCLPAALKEFPTPADLDKLEAARKG